MDLSRRRFMKNTAVVVGAAGVAQSAIGQTFESYSLSDKTSVSYENTFPILQGMTNETSTQIVVMLPRDPQYSYIATNSLKQEIPVRVVRTEKRDHSPWKIERLWIENLNVFDTYTLQVIQDDTGKVCDERTFRALNTNATSAKFAVISCMNDLYRLHCEYMWYPVIESKPDFVILLGDTVYADNHHDGKTEAGFWKRYADTRARISYFRTPHLIPTLATWDDHDYGINNGDKTFKHREMITNIFNLFWAQETTQNLASGPGVATVFSAYGQKFFLMDSRSFRDPKGGKNLHWGLKQEEFLFEKITENANPAWLMNGSQFFGGYLGAESFEGDHSQNFKDILKLLSQVDAPVNFVSGDVHFSEIMAIEPKLLGYRTVEYTSSGIHSYTFPGQQFRKRNPRRLTSTSAHNFLLFNAAVDPQTKQWKITCRCLKRSKRTEFIHEMAISR